MQLLVNGIVLFSATSGDTIDINLDAWRLGYWALKHDRHNQLDGFGYKNAIEQFLPFLISGVKRVVSEAANHLEFLLFHTSPYRYCFITS